MKLDMNTEPAVTLEFYDWFSEPGLHACVDDGLGGTTVQELFYIDEDGINRWHGTSADFGFPLDDDGCIREVTEK